MNSTYICNLYCIRKSFAPLVIRCYFGKEDKHIVITVEVVTKRTGIARIQIEVCGKTHAKVGVVIQGTVCYGQSSFSLIRC